MSGMDLAIETHGLVKTFGDNRAVDGVDLAIRAGGVYGVLGPNGAGKTTTIKMLATLLEPDGGTATVLGYDVVREAAEVRARVAMTGQFASLDEDLTGLENLTLLARLYGYARNAARDRAMQLLEAFDLAESAKKQVKAYSGGMRRRIDIAGSIVVRPDLMFLDEPTTGLDPRSRNQVWEIVRGLVGAGTTILLTTQYLEEADQLADRIAVLDDGRLVAEGTGEQLKQRVLGTRLEIALADLPSFELVAARAGTRADAAAVTLDPHALLVGLPTSGDAAEVRQLLDELDPDRSSIDRFAVRTARLDDVFIALTGHTSTPESEPCHA